MLSKILLTAAVIVTAFFYLRRAETKANSARTALSPASKTEAAAIDEPSTLEGDMRIAAYSFLGLMITLGAVLFYYRWQDEHRILDVSLYGDSHGEPAKYQVYKYQLQERSFITIEGIAVTVAGDERMEIVGLEP